MFELTIIGGGPAGVAAGVYAARKKLKTAFITVDWGGQSTVSEDIQNWIGTPHISGVQLGESLRKHLEEYRGESLEIMTGSKATKIEKKDTGFTVTLANGNTVATQSVLICVGSERRKLPAKNADQFEHKGLTYCASCDGPLFSDRDVVVVGGGNAAFESAAQLLAYCKSVTIVNRTDTFKADPITVEKVTSHQNLKVINSAEIIEVTGDVFVNGITYKDRDGAVQSLATEGIFVEIGLLPNTGCVDGLVELNEYKQIVIDPWTQKTNVPGVWAAGDCTNVRYHQNNIAAGDAVRALEDIYVTLRS
jgi:alkyl hydroperoxide reductase subunit F